MATPTNEHQRASAPVFYASKRRGKHTALLLGPYGEQGIAEIAVPAARDLAVAVDPFCAFDDFGTTKVTPAPGALPAPGLLGSLLDAATAAKVEMAP